MGGCESGEKDHACDGEEEGAAVANAVNEDEGNAGEEEVCGVNEHGCGGEVGEVE